MVKLLLHHELWMSRFLFLPHILQILNVSLEDVVVREEVLLQLVQVLDIL